MFKMYSSSTSSSVNRYKAADYFGTNAENIMVVNSNQKLQLQYLKLLFNKSFIQCCISDILKIGSLFPVCKNKGARYAKINSS